MTKKSKKTSKKISVLLHISSKLTSMTEVSSFIDASRSKLLSIILEQSESAMLYYELSEEQRGTLDERIEESAKRIAEARTDSVETEVANVTAYILSILPEHLRKMISVESD